MSLLQTAKALQDTENQVTVIGTVEKKDQSLGHWCSEVIPFKRYGPLSWHFAPGIFKWLNSSGKHWQVASFQGVWLYPHQPIARFCSENNIPYMITTHGCFNPTALEISKWKKYLAQKTFLKSVLANVTCYQVSTDIEYKTLRKLGIQKPICVIGNGIEMPSLQSIQGFPSCIPYPLSKRKTCLYLGRLHPIKGIENLLQAWSKLSVRDDWQLVIAGSGDPSYVRELQNSSEIKKCQNVHFLGFVTTEEKRAWLHAAEFLVLPSYSEAFAMVPMESFSFGTPALLTKGCSFPEATLAGAALEVDTSVDGLKNGLEKFMAMPELKLKEMSSEALDFVREQYDWKVICAQLEDVYGWMLGSKKIPDCMRLD
ncbi:glycosyltransferase [Leptolyngbya sp. KIOST-1]|uniref:glycosyltransferase n=1 Tax=Leptolyngbya sp. KIOST-1 TaxID=1229172 RepID=UPI001CEC2E5F|nr:glycosyltransferase [Leptolyngbya sp. KIOST-1]